MIGDYKGEVKYRVLKALLQAYHDVLDYDGLKSILKEAEMLHLKDLTSINPNQTLDFFSFKKILSAQNCLLYGSSKLLYKIGKKFSFYLFPFGKNFEDIVKEMNELIVTDWNMELMRKDEDIITIKVRKCIFCSEIGVPCFLFKGFLLDSLEKTLPSNHKVIFIGQKENLRDPEKNTFTLKLKIIRRKKKLLNIK